MPLRYNGSLIPRAKELRRDMTPQEKCLWYHFLAKYPVRFQRQRVINGFIVDFYCYKANLVVEIDGRQHGTGNGPQYDKERTAILNGLGLRVIRFSNCDIDKDFEHVCSLISEAVEGTSPLPPS